MASSYETGTNSGAVPGHPAQQPSVTADQGITEQANQRPDIASNKDTSEHTTTGGDANVPPNPEEIKAETEDGGDKPKAPGGEEYPEQKHAGKVGYGPAYAETHGVVHMSERIGGLKTEIKGKILRKPELVQQGHDEMTGEAKRRAQEQESAPIGGPAPAADPTAGDKPEDKEKEGQVAKGAESDKPIAQAANENATDKDKANPSSVAKEAEQQDQSQSQSTTTPAATGQGQQTSSQSQPSGGNQQQSYDSNPTPNPPAPFKDETSGQSQSQSNNQQSGGQQTYNADTKPNPPAPFKEETQGQTQPQSSGHPTGTKAVNTNPPADHKGIAE